MSIILLIRHGHNDSIGRSIVGRLPGVNLNSTGRGQADSLADRLAGAGITHIYSSPLERARETAAPLSRRLGLEVSICDDLHEIDFGGWTGVSFADLDQDRRWRLFNTFRSGTRTPGGELMVEVQARMVAAVERLRGEHPRGTVALVSHGDPIKTVVAHYAGFPIDHMMRFEISLASVSAIRITDHGPKILCVNSLEKLDDLVRA